jgi:hypothetical protein
MTSVDVIVRNQIVADVDICNIIRPVYGYRCYVAEYYAEIDHEIVSIKINGNDYELGILPHGEGASDLILEALILLGFNLQSVSITIENYVEQGYVEEEYALKKFTIQLNHFVSDLPVSLTISDESEDVLFTPTECVPCEGCGDGGDCITISGIDGGAPDSLYEDYDVIFDGGTP